MIALHDVPAIDAFSKGVRLDRVVTKELRNDVFKRGIPLDSARARLRAAGVSESAIDEIDWQPLELVERRDSALDGASKLLFATRSGERIESVVLRYATGRTSLCISSQVGCAAACAFCATGRMGLVRSLTAAEILDQVVQSNRLLAKEGVRVRNIVFMGMGEPFHNEAAVGEALTALATPALFDYSPQRLLVSTVGVPDAMLRFAQRFPSTNLALSLHSAIDAKRAERMPIAMRAGANIDDLRAAVREVNRIQERPVMIEYVMLEGWNDGEDDLEALAHWLDGLDVHVNLIPYNAIDVDGAASSRPIVGTALPLRESFGAELKRRGFKVTLRYSLGRDIAAACGQLVREESRRRKSAPTNGGCRDDS